MGGYWWVSAFMWHCYKAQEDGTGTLSRKEMKGRTVRCVLLHNLHHAHDPGFLAIRVPEEGKVAFFHRPEVVTCCAARR